MTYITDAENRTQPNAALRALLMAIEDVMGANGAKAVLNLGGLQRYINNFPPNDLEQGVTMDDYGAAQQAVEDFYGGRGARAMLTQIGRATFRFSLEEQPAVLGIAGLALRMLPEKTKVKWILGRVAKAGTNRMNMDVSLTEEDDAYYLIYGTCPGLFRERPDARNELCCFTTIGVVQEALRWVSGGKHFRVQQVNCKRGGHPYCRFCIFKEPME